MSEGAKVHLVGIDEAKLQAAAGELGDENALASVADVTDEDAVKAALASGVDRYGRFDVLFSNAGISGAVAPIADYPSDEFMRTLAVHILGAFHILKHGAPHVPDGGSIIITSSVVGLMGFPGISGYIAAKLGQVGLMREAAKEFAARLIRVTHSGAEVQAAYRDKRYVLPASDVVLLPISNTTAEMLAWWIAQELKQSLGTLPPGVTALEVEVDESSGQRAFYREALGKGGDEGAGRP